MTIQNIPLFFAMGSKMNYLDQRQEVLSHNIANADTPGYRARELSEIDFGRVLDHVNQSNKVRNVRLETTQAGHMPPPNELEDARNQKQRITYEVAPAGNAVIIEEQMVKANQNTIDYNLLTNLMRKNVGMIRTALGRGGQ